MYTLVLVKRRELIHILEINGLLYCSESSILHSCVVNVHNAVYMYMYACASVLEMVGTHENTITHIVHSVIRLN